MLKSNRGWALLVSALVLGSASLVVGWLLRGTAHDEDMYDGNLVKGLVSEVKPDSQTLCIEA